MKKTGTTIRKIAIIGPESTGKSVLAQQLAEHYHTLWVPEYAREYLEKHGTNYSYADLLTIAKGQLTLEDERMERSSNDLLFIDTNMYVMKVWCEVVFGECHPFVEEEINKRQYDLYLLCNVDLPWVKDALREYPELEKRQSLFHIYKTLLEKQDVPWALISGDFNERLNKAVSAVERYIISNR